LQHRGGSVPVTGRTAGGISPALLVLVALVVSAVAASATTVALSSRSDLSASRRRVDAAWARLRPVLDARYARLGDAARTARDTLRSGRAVFDDIDTAVAAWPAAARSTIDGQVRAAAWLEGLAARLTATVATTPRLRSAPDVAAAMTRLQQPDTTAARTAYNAAVLAYQRARGGFPRRLVANALGYDERRTLEVPV
jgi:hypothetical protein